MFTTINLKRPNKHGITILELNGPDGSLEVKFISRLSKRERRAVIRSFLIQIRPWIRHFSAGAISHSEYGVIRDRRTIRRGIKDSRAEPLSSMSGALGFGIRMRRLELGLSQSELAGMVGIQRTHLNALERGLYLPNSKTRTEIKRVLNFPSADV